MERQVGERFFSEYYGNEYEVIKPVRKKSCSECCFWSDERGCMGLLEETGDCRSEFREDDNSVIFKVIKI